MSTDLNALIAIVKIGNPNAKIIVTALEPFGQSQTAPQLAVWRAFAANLGVAGYGVGANPIVGADTIVTSPSLPPINDGSDNMTATYVRAAPHMNIVGNTLKGGYVRAGLHAQRLI